MSMFILAIPLDHVQLTLICEPNIPGSYEILFVTALEFTSITIHLHNWASFLLWPSRFILSGAIHNCPLLFLNSIADTFQPGGLAFWCHILLSFHMFMGFLQQAYWTSLPFSPSVDHFLSELFTMTHPSGWSCTTCLIASLSYTSLFAATRQWSMKESGTVENTKSTSEFHKFWKIGSGEVVIAQDYCRNLYPKLQKRNHSEMG